MLLVRPEITADARLRNLQTELTRTEGQLMLAKRHVDEMNARQQSENSRQLARNHLSKQIASVRTSDFENIVMYLYL